MKRLLAVLFKITLFTLFLSTYPVVSQAISYIEGDEPHKTIETESTPHQVNDTWTFDRSFNVGTITSLANGEDGIVAIGDNGTFLTSEDGRDWEAKSGIEDYNLEEIEYDGERHVLLATPRSISRADPQIFISEDEKNWRQVPSPTDNYIGSLAYGNGTFLLVDKERNLYYSDNGEEWEKISDFSRKPTSISRAFYLGGQFMVVVGNSHDSDANELLVSENGKNWSAKKMSRAYDYSEVIYDGEQYIGLGYKELYTSKNGVEWEEVDLNISASFSSATYYQGEYVVSGVIEEDEGYKHVILTSDNLTDWDYTGIDRVNNLGVLASGEEGILGISSTREEGSHYYFSEDAKNWEIDSIGNNDSFRSIATNGEQVVAVGMEGLIAQSNDGVNWSNVSIIEKHNPNPIRPNDPNHGGGEFLPNFFKVIWGQDEFVAVGTTGIYVSESGTNWDRIEPDPNDAMTTLNEIVWTGDYYYAIGLKGAFVSYDGQEWTEVEKPSNDLLANVYDMEWDGEKIVIIGNTNIYDFKLLYSYDLKEWHEKKIPDPFKPTHLALKGDQFLISSENAEEIMYSSDGENLNDDSSEVPSNQVLSAGDYYLAHHFTDENTILFSKDGRHWESKTLIKNDRTSKSIHASQLLFEDVVEYQGSYILAGRNLINLKDIEEAKPLDLEANLTPYKDINKDYWGYDSILWASSEELMEGYSDGYFQPNKYLTEAEFVTVFKRFFGLKESDSVSEDAHWSQPIYDTLEKLDYPLKGYNNDQVKDQPITRGTVAIVLAYTHADIRDMEEAVDWMYDNSITNGIRDTGDRMNDYGIDQPLQRVEIVSFFQRLVEQGLDKAH